MPLRVCSFSKSTLSASSLATGAMPAFTRLGLRVPQLFCAIIVSRLLSLSGLLWGRTVLWRPSKQATRRRRPTRNARRGAVVAAIVTSGLAGCGPCGDNGDSRSAGGSKKTPEGQTELVNASFEKRSLTPWEIAGKQHASFGVTQRASWEGQRSAEIRARGQVRGSVVLGQLVHGAARDARGSRYRLVMRVRTRDLSRGVPTSIKMKYDNGNFDFFPGRAATAASPAPARSRAGIPPGTSRGWITITVDAVAKRRIAAMGVYAFDSGPGPLRGTVWIDSAELSRREAKPREGRAR
jgi:hypothetical protein